MHQKRDIDYPPDDIGFLDVVSFVIGYWKVIATPVVAGIALAAVYLLVTPKQFEAEALIKVGQVLAPSQDEAQQNRNSDQIPPFSVNLEAPVVIAEQFRQPAAFSDATIKACGSPSPEALLAKVRLRPSRSAQSILDLSVRDVNPQAATQCATAVFEQIRQQQQRQLQPYRTELERRLKDAQDNYRESMNLLEKADQASTQQNLYLARRDNAILLRRQLDEIRRMQIFDNAPQLLAPVYAPQHPAFPIRSKTIVFGAMAGLLLGLALSFVHLSCGRWRQRNQKS